MAALLVGLSIMAVMMTVAMPVWKQMTQRGKEEELVFRGMQYARSVGLYERKYANAPPPSVDVLIQQRFLRRKYKDPITRDDFQLLMAGQAAPGVATPGGTAPQPGTPGATPNGGNGGPTGQPGQTGAVGGIGGGIVGVVSKSKDRSIRVYNGRTHYNEWVFTYAPPTQAPGIGGGTAGAPGQRGGQGPGAGPGAGGVRGAPGSGRDGRGNNPQNPNGPNRGNNGPNGSGGR